MRKIFSKSQVSIFLIIAVMIIFLLAALIYLSGDEKGKKIEETKKDLTTFDSTRNLFPFKDNVDYCLENELKKALIISGLRGGFIISDNTAQEVYAPGVIYQNTYNYNFINNLGLNWNNLMKETLIMSDYDVNVPNIFNVTSKGTYGGSNYRLIYNHSVVDDFEDFMLNQFLKCINLEEYESLGYKVDYNKFSGKVLNYDDSGNIYIDEISGEVGDIITLETYNYFSNSFDSDSDFSNTKFLGVLVSNSTPAVAKFNSTILDSLLSGNILEEIYARNLNSSVDLNVIFKDEKISAEINFPINIKNEDFKTSFEKSSITIENRFKKILDLAEKFLDGKYYNHSLDYSNYSDANSVLSSLGFPYDNINLYKTIINDSDEYKKFVYTILDNGFKIYGAPYIFNFAYENEAPDIDYVQLGADRIIDGGVLFILGGIEEEFNLDLNSYLIEKQKYDAISQHFFRDQTHHDSDADFSINSYGDISFTAHIENRFSYDIIVSDFEAQRVITLVFIVGVINNENNQAATNCISFRNPTDPLFPIEYEYEDKLFSYQDTTTGYNEVFGYYVYYNYDDSAYSSITSPIDNYKPVVKFDLSCITSPTYFNISVEINGNSHDLNMTTGEFTIPETYLPEVLNIKFKIKDPEGNEVNVGNPFNITLYPAACLGPAKPLNYPGSSYGTCCNLDTINLTRYGGNPQDFYTGSNNNLYSSGYGLNDYMYFCFNPSATYFGIDPINFTTHNLWDTYSSGLPIDNPTSLFKGKVVATCDGKYPSVLHNIDSIEATGSNDLNSNAEKLYLNNIYDLSSSPFSNFDVKLTNVSAAGKCEFCSLDSVVGDILLNNGLAMSMQMDVEGSDDDPNIENLPYGMSNVFVLCSDDIMYSENGIEWIEAIFTSSGKDGGPKPLYLSKSYCTVDSSVCTGRTNSPGFVHKIDEGSDCKDYYFQNVEGGTIQTFTGYFDDTYICKTIPVNPLPTCPGNPVGSITTDYNYVCTSVGSCNTLTTPNTC